jgi:DNA-binding MarR family transcriptional regulator
MNGGLIMTHAKTNEQVTEYCHLYRELNTEYEEYAKSVDMSFSSLLVLSIICSHPNGCMQMTIRDESFLPKQTVNGIVTGFLRQGLIKLTEVESDRRYKTIHLTENGSEFANRLIPKIKDAENKAMENLTENQRMMLLETTRLFITRFREFMREKTS